MDLYSSVDGGSSTPGLGSSKKGDIYGWDQPQKNVFYTVSLEVKPRELEGQISCLTGSDIGALTTSQMGENPPELVFL